MGKKKSPKKPSPRKYLSKKSTTKKYPSMKESAPASTSTSKHMPSSADSGVIPALEDLEISLPTDSTAPTDLNPPMDSIPETDSSAEKITILSGDLDSAATDTGSDLPIAPVKVVSTTSPRPIEKTKVIEAQNLFTDTKPQSSTHKTSEDTYLLNQEKKKPDDSWCDIAKGSAKKLQKKGTAFTLSSGESCVKIPNSVIEKNRSSWDCFVLGQFYSDPPSQGTIHNIVNGIWSRYYRDITVSKMEGFSFLFRIPNVATRNRIINQRLWQIEGQTMFVAKWEPGIVASKPELSAAPIWLELRNVPLQFFNEDGLERIASLVGDPKFLHPATANKTNLDVASGGASYNFHWGQFDSNYIYRGHIS